MDRVEDRKWANLPRKKVHGKFAQRGRTGHHHSLVSLKTGLGLQRRHRGYARLSPYTLQFPKLHWNLFPAFDWGHFFTTGKGKAFLAFVIIGLAVNGVYFAIDSHSPGRQALDELTGTKLIDPYTLIYSPGSVSSGFNHVGGASFHGAACPDSNGQPCETFSSNSTTTSVALSKNSIGQLGVVSGKNLFAYFEYEWLVTTNCCSFTDFGWYLTTNGTLPSHAIGSSAFYNPKNDPSVAMLMDVGSFSGGNGLYVLFIQKESATPTTIAAQDNAGCTQSGSAYLCFTDTVGLVVAQKNHMDAWALNYTGAGAGSSTSGISEITTGNNAAITVTATTTFPWFNLNTGPLYLGLYETPKGNPGSDTSLLGVDYGATINSVPIVPSIQLGAVTFTPSSTPPSPTTDTGSFFGAALQFLVSTFIPGGSLIVSAFTTATSAFPGLTNILGSIVGQLEGAVYGAIAAIVDTLVRGLSAFEAVAKTVINFIGSAFGFPGTSTNCGVAGGTCALGDLVFLWMSNFITFLAGTFNTLLAQLAAIFTGIFNAFLVFVQWIVQAFSFLTSILLFAVNIAVFAFGIFTTALKWTTIFVPFWIFIFFLGFNADDGMAGWITWFNFLKWITFDIGVSWTLLVLNYSIDVVLFLIGLIPKPFIQMSISKIPRLPILDIHGSFAIPDFKGDALKEGNLFAILGMLGGFIGFVWYELTQTGIPGTLAAEFPSANFVTTGATAITFYKLFLPMAVLVVFLLMIPTLFTSVFGVRVAGSPGMPISVRTGRHGFKGSRAPASRLGFVKTSPSRLGRRIEKRALAARSKVDKAFKEEQLRNKREEEARQKAVAQKELEREAERKAFEAKGREKSVQVREELKKEEFERKGAEYSRKLRQEEEARQRKIEELSKE